jgi:hypothetical protein
MSSTAADALGHDRPGKATDLRSSLPDDGVAGSVDWDRE